MTEGSDNLALLADIRRMMLLLGLPSGLDAGGVRVDSVMSFVGRILSAFGATNDREDFLNQYEHACRQVLEAIRSGGISRAEIGDLLGADPEKFAFDLVLVDEGQDWPIWEIELLRACYSPQCFVIADGVDQLVRGARAAWTLGLPPTSQKIWRLDSCLRMKRNITVFANRLAHELGLTDWDLTPSEEARGGRVVVIQGQLSSQAELVRAICDDALTDGNLPIDLLFCAPPKLRSQKMHGDEKEPVEVLTEAGFDVWDATEYDVRREIPRDTNQVRLVQYASCRGLEGWMVCCFGLDKFFEHALDVLTPVESDFGGVMDEESRLRNAARWLMIPVTRAMDTIVIEIGEQPSVLGQALERVKRALPDFVEWRRVGETE